MDAKAAVLQSFDDEFNPFVPEKKPASAVPNAEAPKPADGAQPQAKFHQEIDLGDGSGVQVFEGNTAEELINKLTEAQKNATIKIRDLSREMKLGMRQSLVPAPDPQPEIKPRTLTSEEKFLIAQKFQDDPDAAFSSVFSSKFGMTPEQMSQEIQLMRAERAGRQEEAESKAFMDAVPEYYATEKNATTMLNYLQANKLAITAGNLAYAYDELQDVLDPAPQDSDAATETRIENPQPQQTRQMTVGLSENMQQRVETTNQPVFDAEEFRKLPAAERRARIERMAWQEKQSQSR